MFAAIAIIMVAPTRMMFIKFGFAKFRVFELLQAK
jgi:hypothetical protein